MSHLDIRLQICRLYLKESHSQYLKGVLFLDRKLYYKANLKRHLQCESEVSVGAGMLCTKAGDKVHTPSGLAAQGFTAVMQPGP